MIRTVRNQPDVFSLPTVAGSTVALPSDGPVLFADSEGSDAGRGSVVAKTPDGSTLVLGPSYTTDVNRYGATSDTVQTEATVEALASTAIVADALSQADVGKVISIEAAGDGADLITTIAEVSADGLTVTLADAAVDGATDAVTFVGTSDAAALTAADAAADGTLLVPPGVYLVDDDVALISGTVKVLRGASFVVLEGFTLAIDGFVEAAADQIPALLDADCLGALTRTIPNTMTGTGSPEAAVVGIIGDLYTDLAGTTDTTLWVKESGDNTNTGWVANEAPA